MKIRYTETSLVEIDGIIAYISKLNATAAARIVARVEQTIANLGDYPELAQTADETNVRRMPSAAILFYTIEADEVVILHVRHAARQWPWEDDR
jgi:plasmid stabilization system protein ParE